LSWGLINRVFDDTSLMDEALALAKKLSEGPTQSLGAIRRLYWESPHNSFEVQIDLERQTQQRAGKTEDFHEGVTAFLEKRPAKFQGK
jgi:2-(1,2-epoxy-1,2-dihydrophenyl)acetyl-CoA isomerase